MDDDGDDDGGDLQETYERKRDKRDDVTFIMGSPGIDERQVVVLSTAK